ncbi:hypothetical protein GCM10027598_28330 [Amycolatopsis oliviviridis]|uniref:Uncharacterized protein n=1 Tax=Amycolatopsis oliviviridis TaxID=1471590 RepID=A0ABQ3MCU4_9PSEU|nr:hypothetical protein [Amycolatopsis oliviviridis]GHH37490.1 hypothetical protein GCM10017790_81940 [Amycolatopsis oliviviridis]
MTIHKGQWPTPDEETDVWKKVQIYPGMSGGSVKRYRPVLSATTTAVAA